VHDEALAKLATDAGTAGDVEVTKDAIKVIATSSVLDEAARKAALNEGDEGVRGSTLVNEGVNS
jgi:hypothetical protein